MIFHLDRHIDLGYALVRSVDTVCRMPHAAMLRTIERWQTQVLPRLGLA